MFLSWTLKYQSKALASLITNYLQTSANPSFQQSLYHSLLYRQHCLQDTSVPDMELPPYYTHDFFNTIKEVIESSPLNPVRMSVKDWYRYLLERNVTMDIIDEEGRMEKKKCKVEEDDPESDWSLSYRLSRIKGLTPQVKTFNFKLLHRILPCKQRLSQILPNSLPFCNLCPNQLPDSLSHSLFNCLKNREASQFLLHLTRVYFPEVTPDQVLKLQIKTDALYELPTTLVRCTGLELIGRNRQAKKSTSLCETQAELECLVVSVRKSRPWGLREATSIIQNTCTLS